MPKDVRVFYTKDERKTRSIKKAKEKEQKKKAKRNKSDFHGRDLNHVTIFSTSSSLLSSSEKEY